MISQISNWDVLQECYQVLGLSIEQDETANDLLLASLLRRSAGIHCPCSRVTLQKSILDSLKYLTDEKQPLSERVEAAIEGLIVGGDLLELNDVVFEDSNATGSWVFAAPPSFIVRRDGSIFVIGIVPDQDTFLPNSLSELITYDSYTRTIESPPGRDIRQELQEQGLRELSESAWLKSPKQGTAESILDQYKDILDNQPSAGHIQDLRILDFESSVSYYKGRWKTHVDNAGTYVARRPQEFGAPIWCLTHVEGGQVVRFLDLPFGKTRWRGCDMAWYLQMAIDHIRGCPQQYLRSVVEDEIRLDFFSPLPLWTRRRLMLFGRSVQRERCLFSYMLARSQAQAEEQNLQETLWLSPKPAVDTNQGVG